MDIDLPWADLVGLIAIAEDQMARLDERLRSSPIRDGWIARTHFSDAIASRRLEGELVHIEDLVLHDGRANMRAPTHELTLANLVLRLRRRLANEKPGWAISRTGLRELAGKTADGLSLGEWCDALEDWGSLPATLAAALAYRKWGELMPVERQPWLGNLLAGEVLRARGKTNHLPCLSFGLDKIHVNRRRSPHDLVRLKAYLEGIATAASEGLKDHGRWLLARELLERKTRNKRVNSRLSRLIEFAIQQPIISATSISRELAISPRAALDLVGELGLRELSGRDRYRVWGVI